MTKYICVSSRESASYICSLKDCSGEGVYYNNVCVFSYEKPGRGTAYSMLKALKTSSDSPFSRRSSVSLQCGDKSYYGQEFMIAGSIKNCSCVVIRVERSHLCVLIVE